MYFTVNIRKGTTNFKFGFYLVFESYFRNTTFTYNYIDSNTYFANMHSMRILHNQANTFNTHLFINIDSPLYCFYTNGC